MTSALNNKVPSKETIKLSTITEMGTINREMNNYNMYLKIWPLDVHVVDLVQFPYHTKITLAAGKLFRSCSQWATIAIEDNVQN